MSIDHKPDRPSERKRITSKVCLYVCVHCMCVYIYVFVCVFVCVYVCMYMHIHIYVSGAVPRGQTGGSSGGTTWAHFSTIFKAEKALCTQLAGDPRIYTLTESHFILEIETSDSTAFGISEYLKTRTHTHTHTHTQTHTYTHIRLNIQLMPNGRVVDMGLLHGYLWVMSHTRGLGISHLWICHVTHMDKSCQ